MKKDKRLPVRRIIIDSQSNPHFLGIESEQQFDQRAALSQGRRNDIAVTTNPIDPNYISYWKNLGFTLPTLLVAGPFEKTKILSQLIYEKESIVNEIRSCINGSEARLEFFTPSDEEENLAKHLVSLWRGCARKKCADAGHDLLQEAD